eukprot:symbB.v1.2.010375.t1/scaffold678.1/size173209/3
MGELFEEISESLEAPRSNERSERSVLDIPSSLVAEFFQQKRKAPTKPADLLIPLTALSEEHVDEAIRSDRAGHGRCNRRVQQFLQKSARTGRPSRDLGVGKVSRRPKDLSPIDAAREATAKKVAKKSRGRRNSTDQSQSNLPRNRDVLVGWQDLLNEIASSSRRLRAARGGAQDAAGGAAVTGPGPGRSRSPESRPRTQETGVGSAPTSDDENDDGLWLSYRIREEMVPNALLLRMWNYAVDPRKDEGIQALERVPRLTVTKRDVRPLPMVNDFVQWRLSNKRRRETRKAKKEAERNPTLEEMLIAIFGEEDMDLLQLDEAQLQKHRADENLDEALTWIAQHCDGGSGGNGSPSPKSTTSMPGTPSAQQQRLKLEELELLKEIQLILTNDADEALQAFRDLEPKLVGALRRGRRGAFDEGKASAKLALSIADLQARQDKNVVRCKKLRRGFEHSRAIRKLPSDRVQNEALAELHMKEVVKSFTSVVENCERRSQRFHETFVRRQGHLSERLSRRVKRIQTDHCEIQSEKQQSILPCVISDNAAAFLSVLHFLKPHRVTVERKRQDAHSIYMRQVEKIQHFTHLLADPNREAERGEVYLSQCFRHVLAAGLAVDKCYFFRVLRNLELEDFQKVFTVNFLAACCDAFSISVRDYTDYLKSRGFPLLAPTAATSSALPYDDTAAWDAVTLQPWREVFVTASGDTTFAEAPLYPILPTETPHTSELVSREDPLHEILQSTVYDAVLERYAIGPKTSKVEEEMGPELCRGNTNTSLMDGSVQHEQSWATARIPRPPVQMAAEKHNFRQGKFQAGCRPFEPHGHKTLRRMWGVAEPMGESQRATFVKKTSRAASQMQVVPENAATEAMSP